MYRLRLLVAENHEELRRAVIELLSIEFEVVADVTNGEQLIKSALTSDPDVIVSDIAMPVKDGFTAMKELRLQRVDIPFVFMTMMRIEGFPNGCQDDPVCYVHKADLATELGLAVQAAVDGHSYVSQTFRRN
jgi:DNA-binding NarL/FixJ family response regulator